MNLRDWRRRDWDTAVEAAVARYIGTSLEMIDRHYGHLVRGADDAFHLKLDAYSACPISEANEAQGDG